MKFWEAMKASHEGKKVRRKDKPLRIYISTDGGILRKLDDELIDLASHSNAEWEIIEEPELYWQWRHQTAKSFKVDKHFRTKHQAQNCYVYTYEKHAGPWIKTENGFEKHETWEQF